MVRRRRGQASPHFNTTSKGVMNGGDVAATRLAAAPHRVRWWRGQVFPHHNKSKGVMNDGDSFRVHSAHSALESAARHAAPSHRVLHAWMQPHAAMSIALCLFGKVGTLTQAASGDEASTEAPLEGLERKRKDPTLGGRPRAAR